MLIGYIAVGISQICLLLKCVHTYMFRECNVQLMVMDWIWNWDMYVVYMDWGYGMGTCMQYGLGTWCVMEWGHVCSMDWGHDVLWNGDMYV